MGRKLIDPRTRLSHVHACSFTISARALISTRGRSVPRGSSTTPSLARRAVTTPSLYAEKRIRGERGSLADDSCPRWGSSLASLVPTGTLQVHNCGHVCTRRDKRPSIYQCLSRRIPSGSLKLSGQRCCIGSQGNTSNRWRR